MASPTETPSWNNRGKCGCKGCAVARAEGYKMGRKDAALAVNNDEAPSCCGCRTDQERYVWLARGDGEQE